MHDAPVKRPAPLAIVLAVGAAYAVGAQLPWTVDRKSVV